MVLSQDIIFFHLSRSLPVNFAIRTDVGLSVGRPVFYERQSTLNSYAVIITAPELTALFKQVDTPKGVLFICIDVLDAPLDIPGNSAITIDAAVNPFCVFNELQSIFNLFDRWDASLNTIYYEGRSFTELIDCCNEVLFDPVCIVDKQFHYVTYSKLSEMRGLVKEFVDLNSSIPLETVNEMIRDSAFSKTFKIREAYEYSFTMGDVVSKNIYYRDEYVGRITVKNKDSGIYTVSYYKAVLDQLCVVAENLYKKYMSFNQNEISLNSLRGLILNVFEKKGDTANQWEKAASENGWNTGDQLQLVQFRPNPRHDKNMYAKYLGTALERQWQGCACFEYEERFLLLVNRDKFNSETDNDFNKALPYFLRDNLLVAGLSRPFRLIEHVCTAYNQTETALEFGIRKASTFWYFNFDDYALDYMLEQCRGVYASEQICSEKLMLLMQHDIEKGTEHYKTLQTYFTCKFNAVAAARKLFIHRSSFINRMERIQELVHIDYDSNEELLYLSMSFEMLKAK